MSERDWQWLATTIGAAALAIALGFAMGAEGASDSIEQVLTANMEAMVDTDVPDAGTQSTVPMMWMSDGNAIYLVPDEV